jgi:hypothetical protein
MVAVSFPDQPGKHIIILVAFGAGVLLGSGAAWWYVGRRLADHLLCLRAEVRSLNDKVSGLQQCVQELLSTKQQLQLPLPVLPPSSAEDDDDIYEDAYGGPVSWVGGLSSDQVSSYSTEDGTLVEDIPLNDMLNNTPTAFYSDIDRLLGGKDGEKKAAFQQLIHRQKDLSGDVEFVWRLSKATYFMSQFEASIDKERQKELVYQALNYAGRALQMDDNNPDVHKWYAITLGSIGDYESITVKIRNGFDFKKHIERAIQLNPKDPTAHYLLGRWCFGVYMLSWVERKMAATLFAVPPTATVEEALERFLEADRLNPGKWKENMLFIAKCHIQKRDYVNAVEWLDKADQVPIHGHDDELYQKEVTTLLKQYAIYRPQVHQ